MTSNPPSHTIKIPHISQDALVALYCETQESTPEQLNKTLAAQRAKYHPKGFMLLRCAMLDSSFLGSRTILAFGPNNTYKAVPSHPISPRGLASDMSTVEAICLL